MLNDILADLGIENTPCKQKALSEAIAHGKISNLNKNAPKLLISGKPPNSLLVCNI